MQTRDTRSLGQLVGDLADDVSTLVRQEVALAKTEMGQKASETGKQIGFLAAGGAVAYAGFLGILAGIIAVLAMVVGIAWWLSALIVGIVVAAIGYFLIQSALSALKRADMAPRQTIDTLKEDAQWAKRQTQ